MESHQNFRGIDRIVESFPIASATTACEKTEAMRQRYAGRSKRSSSAASGDEHTGGVPSVGYVEDVFSTRTKLGTFFSVPLIGGRT